MKLSELKKFSAKKRAEIAFPLPNGMECVVDKHGVARVPNLASPPDFNLEEMAAGAQNFSVRLAGAERPKPTSRAEMEKLVSSLGGNAASSAADHDE